MEPPKYFYKISINFIEKLHKIQKQIACPCVHKHIQVITVGFKIYLPLSDQEIFMLWF